jgi:hypothetical protein
MDFFKIPRRSAVTVFWSSVVGEAVVKSWKMMSPSSGDYCRNHPTDKNDMSSFFNQDTFPEMAEHFEC